jgi:trans-aconitate methyltransferase
MAIDLNYRERMIRTISANETMLTPGDANLAHYFAFAESGLECIRLALQLAGKREVRTILDLPCGYGRVLRVLKAAFPAASLTACDLDREGVDFCVETFGAKGVYSAVNFDDVAIDEQFDLIWSGSLLTHLPERAWKQCLQFYLDHLAPEGVLVFSMHGRYSAETTHFFDWYGMAEENREEIMRGYNAHGFGYSEYSPGAQYGMTIAKPAWVLSALEQHRQFTLLYYMERAWGHHHDLVACVRRPIAVEDV